MVNKAEFSRRARKIRGNKTLHQFAKILEVSHTSVKRYEGGLLPPADVLLKYAKAGGIDLSELLTGVSLKEGSSGSKAQLEKPSDLETDEKAFFIDSSEYVNVPLTDGKIAAGEPVIAEENIVDHMLLHIRALKKTGASRDLVGCRVEGDSMSPHLNSGDIVVIDRGIDKEKVIEKKIYAVYNDGGITAKTLQKDGFHLYLIPLNNSYRIQHIDLRENNSPIVGLVIGAWRNFEGTIF